MKILVVMVTLLIVWAIFRKKVNVKVMALMFAMFIFVGYVINIIPFSPMEEILTLTALGKGNENAQNSEVVIESIMVDGKKCEIKPLEGKWFYIGEQYMWRPKTDDRQPAGVTETVSLAIPVGKERSINFLGDVWRGKVQVSCNDKTEIVDTYQENSRSVNISVCKSNPQVLALNEIKQFTIPYLLCCALTVLVIIICLRFQEKYYLYFKRNWDQMLYWVISILMLLFMFKRSCAFSFTDFDEYMNLGLIISKDTLLDVVRSYNVRCIDLSPPLFNIVAYMWYKIMPYGTQFLYILTESAVAIGVLLMSYTGKKIGGSRVGVATAVLGATCSTLIINAAYDFRPYSFLFLFSALTMITYVDRGVDNASASNRKMILFGLSMALLAYSHYHGVFICATLFLADCFLFYKKRIGIRYITSYCIAGITYLPWMIAIFPNIPRGGMWYQTHPDLTVISNLIRYLTGNYMPVVFVFLFGMFVIIFSCLNKNKFGRMEDNNILKAILLWTVVANITIIYIYGRFINPGASLWLDRYFIGLFPFVLVICSSAVDEIYLLNAKFKNVEKMQVGIMMILVFALFQNLDSVIPNSSIKSGYEQSAEWIMSQGDIYSKNTVVLSANSVEVMNSIDYYFMQQLGKRDSVNMISANDISCKDILKFDKIYLWSWFDLSHQEIQTIDQYFDLQEENYGFRTYIKK
ncbi:MAG: hypothetical protein RR313_09300 [Anaerovoracaceae bacterium]